MRGNMNRKAIDLLDNLIGMVEDNQESDYDTALKMGKQALSQEPQCTEQPCLGTLCRYYKEPCRVKNELNVELNELKPCDDVVSRQAVDEIKELMTDINGDTVYAVRMSDIRQLPPVTPSCDKCAMNGSGSKYCDNCKQKSGKWIVDSTVVEKTRQYVTYECGYRRIMNYHMDVHCSKCGFKYAYTTDKEDSIPTNYCPNCGARMVESQESEDKE